GPQWQSMCRAYLRRNRSALSGLYRRQRLRRWQPVYRRRITGAFDFTCTDDNGVPFVEDTDTTSAQCDIITHTQPLDVVCSNTD
ncbi:MAG: hypothetical protein AAFX99_22850, partial [Myxococcota bacterium]